MTMTDAVRQNTFILASASPRRKLLLRKAGYMFEVICSGVDESAFEADEADPIGHARRLALAKAEAVARKYPGRLVLAADTVVDFNGTIIGKPRDAADAERITRLLFSAPHKVITGIALVYPKRLTGQQIARHIHKGDWKGKAGAYGIQETGDEFVERIEGSFTNVIGLPMERVQRLLAQLNITPNP